jgi:acyl CoA:acetate/3-ketoacid CoA transferase alpha subunit
MDVLGKPLGDKVMTAREAVQRFVSDGATIGMGGQSIGRCSVALAHEIVRQGKKDLTLVGCNLALSMDVMVGAGLVKRTECGTGNLERFGTAFRWRKAIEEGRLEIEDYSHLAMASRFLAGSLGLPFMPTKSMLGTDLLAKRRPNANGNAFEIIKNPWDPEEPVVLMPACTPDVSIVHVQKADEMGNLIIEGFTTHELEMIKASKTVVASCEELISSDDVRRHPDRTTIPYIFVDAVVEQPWGAYPTSVYKYYEHDEDHLRHYQSRAQSGGEPYEEYLKEFIYDCATFDDFLTKALPETRRAELHDSMLSVI